MNRFTLVERIGIECGIYQKLKLSEIERKSEKHREAFQERSELTGRSLRESIRAEKTAALPENVKQKAYAVKWDVPNGV